MAQLKCKCGTVAIHLRLPPVLRYECCCVDCRKGLATCAVLRREPPPALSDNVFFPNALTVASGTAKLRCLVIKRHYPTRRVVASCCDTPLLADHPAYAGKRLAAYNNAPAVLRTLAAGSPQEESAAALRPVDARIYQDDMTAAELAALPAATCDAPTGPDEHQRLWADSTAAAEAALQRLAATSAAVAATAPATVTVQELIDSIGSVGVSDPDHGGPTPRWLRSNPPGPTSTDGEESDELGCQRHLFDLDGSDDDGDYEDESGSRAGGVPSAERLYFDAAGKSPLLRAAAAAGRRAVGLKSKPWRFKGAKLDEAEAEARALFATIVGCEPIDVALAPSTSHAMTMASRNIPLAAPRNRVLVMANQMPSNVMPWQASAARAGGGLVVCKRPADFDWTRALLAAIEAHKATLGAAALCPVDWTDG